MSINSSSQPRFNFCVGLRFKIMGVTYTVTSPAGRKDKKNTTVEFTDGVKTYSKNWEDLINDERIEFIGV